MTAGGFTLAGCKQEAGEKCEINSDCAAGLICTGRGFCSVTADEPVDAAPTSDARTAVDTTAPITPDAASVDQAVTEVAVASDVPAVSPDVTPATPDVSPDSTPDTAAAKPDGSSN